MSKNIFDISNWSIGQNYIVNDIVKYEGLYYYCLENHISQASFENEVLKGKWGGYYINAFGQKTPEFIWKPSYNSVVNLNPRVRLIKFGEGYEQRLRDGLNDILMELDLVFEQRDIDEFTAISHFFYERGGRQSFGFTPPEPYNVRKNFILRNWNSNWVSYNNNSIQGKFEEVPI